MIKFYYSPRSSATRCQFALDELGVPYEKIRIDLQKGDQKKPEYLAINPNAKVPALVDGDTTVFESVAILFHLGARYGVDKGLWPKAGTPEEAEAQSWTIWSLAELHPPIIDVIMNAVDMAWTHPKEHRSEYVANLGRKRWAECIQILDRRLSGREFLVGKSFSLVDLAVGMTAGMGAMFGNLPVDSKNVGDWLGRIQSRPAFAKVMAEQ